MQKTNKRIKDFLKKHRFNKNYAVVAAVLSLVVAFTVTASLILPAITATEDSYGVVNLSDGSTAIVLDGDNITGVDFVISDSESSNLDSKNVTFNLSYVVGKGLLNSTNKVMTYQLPDGIAIPSAVVGTEQIIYDGSFVAGHFTISETGFITITCTDEYIEEKQTELNTTGATGTLKFEATINREADNNGDITIDFGTVDNPVKVTIPFNARTLDVSKEGTPNSDGTITWMITVENPQEHDLGGYVLSDPMFVGLTNVDQTHGTYDAEKGTYTFNEGVTEKLITFTYDTKITSEDILGSSSNYGNISNTVDLTPDEDGEDDEPVSDKADVNVNSAFDLKKSGTPDYSDVSNPSVDWKITILNNMGVNLNGTTIQDAAFKLIDASAVTVPDGVTFELDNTTGRLTITSDTTLASVDITYNMTTDNAGNKITLNSQIINSVQLVDDKNTPEDTSDDTIFRDTYDKYVTYQPYYFDKSSYVDNVNEKITWTLIFNKYNNNSLAEDLAGFKIYDEMLKYADEGSIQVTEEFWPHEEVDYTINDAGDTITLVNSNNETGVRIVFTTSATEYADENGRTSNTANVIAKDSDDILYTDTDTVTFDPNNEITKYFQGATVDANNEDLKELSYYVKVLQDSGLVPQTVTDSLTTLNAEGAEFYITKAQAEAIVVKSQSRKEGEWEVTMDTSLYTFKFYDNDGNLIDFEANPDAKAVEFEFVLLDSVTDADLQYVTVSYKATADASNVKAGETVTFKNDAGSPVIGYSISTEHPHKKIDYTDIPYKKYNAKNDGTSDRTKLKLTDLETVKIDNVDYYVMDWYVELNENGNYDNIKPLTFTDTLPEGFEIYGDMTIYAGLWENRANAMSWTFSTDNWSNQYYQTEMNGDNQVVTIYFNDTFTGVRTVYYKAIIPVSELKQKIADSNSSYVFSNTFDDTNEKYAPITQTQEVKEGVLTKESLDAANSYKRYQITVNPSGANLSSGDEITLTDTFITTDYNDGTTTYYCSDKGAVNVNLTNIKVYEVNSDGTRAELDKSEYTYLFDNKPELKTTDYKFTFLQNDPTSKYWYASDVTIPQGVEVTIHMEGVDYESTDNLGYCGVSLKNKGQFNDTDLGYGYYTSDGNGNATYTFTTSGAYTGDFLIEMWTADNIPDNVYVTYTVSSHDYAAKLEMNLPDEKSLIVEYTYYCTPNEYAGDKVGVLNSVATDTQMGAETAENGDVLVLTGDSSGTIQTDKYLTLEKVDVGTYSANLSADFNLYKYNPDDGSWLPATSVTRESDGKPYLATWGASADSPCAITTAGSGEDQFIISLEQEVVFKLVEARAPDGYEPLTEPIYFAYGSIPASDEIPTGLTSADIELTLPEGSMYIKNYTYTDVTVTKEWDDGNETHSSDSVKVQLYRSTTRKTSGFPTSLEAVGDPVTLDSSNIWQYIWEDLPTGNDDGQAYYYYVKELSFTLNGTEHEATDDSEYVPYYVGNGVNKSNGTPIKVVNASGLEVEKLWVDADNKTMDAPLDEIKFEIYKSKTSPADPNRENATNGLPADAVKIEIDSQTEFALNSVNNWKVLVKNLDYADEEGNRYYYYVLETSKASGFMVSYNGNGASNSGVIQIKNKADTKIDIDTGTTLPETGGRGTTIFYVIGLAIIVCAVITAVLIEKRKFLKE